LETEVNDKYKKMASTPFGIDAFVICFIYTHKLPLFFSFVKPFLNLLQLLRARHCNRTRPDMTGYA